MSVPADNALEPAQAAELIAAGAELIDVRRPVEFGGGRIAGARNIEMNELAPQAEALPRDRPLLVYCRAGNRSQMAAEALRQAGFDAHHLAGGLEAWVSEGREIDPPDGAVVARPPAS